MADQILRGTCEDPILNDSDGIETSIHNDRLYSSNLIGSERQLVLGAVEIRAARGKLALGSDIVRSGEMYEFVANVNAQLMLDDDGSEHV